jgi:hypothetical protein
MRKIQFLLILAVVGVLVAVVGGFLLTAGKTVGQSLFGRSFAEGQVRDYVGAVLKQETNGVRCQAVDTNKNGYVSCDYTTASQPENPRSIECAAWGIDGFLNRGCKTRVPEFQQ